MFRFITERSLLIEHRTNWTEEIVMHTVHTGIKLEADALVSKESLFLRAPELCNHTQKVYYRPHTLLTER